MATIREKPKGSGRYHVKIRKRGFPTQTRTFRTKKDPKIVQQLKSNGLGATAIAKKLGIGRASVYRVLSI